MPDDAGPDWESKNLTSLTAGEKAFLNSWLITREEGKVAVRGEEEITARDAKDAKGKVECVGKFPEVFLLCLTATPALNDDDDDEVKRERERDGRREATR